MKIKVLAGAIAGALLVSAVVCARTLPDERIDRAFLRSGECSKEGDPGFYVDFGADTHEMSPGETFCWTVAPTNFGFVSSTCPDSDTFCVHVISKQGWIVTADPEIDNCVVLGPGYLWWQDICLSVPCESEVGEKDTLIMQMTYCDDALACRDDCSDCEDPNWYAGVPRYSQDTVIVNVVAAPPSLYIEQDSLYIVERGQSAAYVPFEICNGDPCAGDIVYQYEIRSTGHVGGVFPQGGTTDPISGGDCDDVHAIVNAALTPGGTFDTLTIVAWDQASATVYDSCVQTVLVVEGI